LRDKIELDHRQLQVASAAAVRCAVAAGRIVARIAGRAVVALLVVLFAVPFVPLLSLQPSRVRLMTTVSSRTGIALCALNIQFPFFKSPTERS
jgi:hypothetical protein